MSHKRSFFSFLKNKFFFLSNENLGHDAHGIGMEDIFAAAAAAADHDDDDDDDDGDDDVP